MAQVGRAFVDFSPGGLIQAPQQVSVAFLLHILPEDEAQSRAVDAITQAAQLSWTIREHMAQMHVTGMTPRLCADHAVREIPLFTKDVRIDGLCEAGPTAAGFEFIRRGKERLAGGDNHIDAGPEGLVKRILKGPLHGVFLRNLVLQGRKGLQQLFRGKVAIAVRVLYLRYFWWYSSVG